MEDEKKKGEKRITRAAVSRGDAISRSDLFYGRDRPAAIVSPLRRPRLLSAGEKNEECGRSFITRTVFHSAVLSPRTRRPVGTTWTDAYSSSTDIITLVADIYRIRNGFSKGIGTIPCVAGKRYVARYPCDKIITRVYKRRKNVKSLR